MASFDNVSKKLDLPKYRATLSMITPSSISKDASNILRIYDGACHSIGTKRATTVMPSKIPREGQQPDPQITTPALCKPSMG